MNLRYMLKIALLSMVVLTIACLHSAEESSTVEYSEHKLTVLATTPMLGDFVKQVAGQNIEVQTLMPYSVDPHTFEPSPKDVREINEAHLVFYIGLKYETNALTKLLQNSVESEHRLIEIGSKVNPIEFRNDDHDDHDDHGDEDDDDHGTLDPHFWFDPNRVALAVGEIKNELIKLDPDNKDAYESAATSYIAELTALDAQVEALIQTVPSNDRQIVTTHESLGYLEARYGLNILVAIIPSITSEDDVTPKQLVSVIEEVKEHKIKVIFLETESPTKSSEIIAQETGVSLVSGLWVETLEENQSYIDFLNTNVNLIVENLIKYGHDDDHGDEDMHEK